MTFAVIDDLYNDSCKDKSERINFRRLCIRRRMRLPVPAFACAVICAGGIWRRYGEMCRSAFAEPELVLTAWVFLQKTENFVRESADRNGKEKRNH